MKEPSNNMPPILPRLRTYITNNSSQWIPVTLIYTVARRAGYATEAITQALESISHTPPFAKYQATAGDHHALKHAGITQAGVYYKKQPMTPQELQRNKEGLEAFELL